MTTTEQSHVVVTVRINAAAPPVIWELWDDPPRGTHPRPAEACAALNERPEALDPVPPGTFSAQVFGGPETARVTGHWRGRRVDASFARNNAAEMGRWSALAALLQPGGRGEL